MRRLSSVEDLTKPNCRQNANWLSALTFWYTIPTFRLGSRRDLEDYDLTKPLDEHKSSYLGEKISKLWMKEVETNEKPSIDKVVFKCFFFEIFIYGLVLSIMELFIRLLQPIFLGLLLRYFNPKKSENHTIGQFPMYFWRIIYYWTPNQSAIQYDEALLYASGLIVVSMMCVIVLHPYMMAVMHVGMKMRVACCSLLYRKALRLSLCSLGGRTVGNVVNLMSNDVNRFDVATLFVHYLWISPLQLVVITYFMYKEMGSAAILGIIVVIGFIPLQAWFGKTTSIFRSKTAFKTDDRVRQMNEIISGIQVIKMYTWEYAFANLINESRKQEIQVLKYTSYVRGMIMSFIMFIARLAILVTVVSYALYGYEITAEKAFVVTSYFVILRQTMTVYFPQGIAQVAEAHVALSRIQNFMLSEEAEVGDPTPLDSKLKKQETTEKQIGQQSVSIKNASAKYGDEICLRNINLELQPATLTGVIGQVGSGKSCLLNLILGELLPYEGHCKTNGIIAYAAQEPWLFAGSVRQNILFGRHYERGRYQQVVRVCALLRDFSLLPYGDKTIVGERGVSLSGGQRARVNLARAVYKKADIYLLDDPLSAVDAHVGKQIFDECISGYLSDKIVVLATHQLQYMKTTDQVVIMDQGRILGLGTFDKLRTSDLNFAKLLEEQPGRRAKKKDDVQQILAKISINSAMSMSTVDPEGQLQPHEVGEMRTFGSVSFVVYKEYFKAGGNCFVIFIMGVMFLLAQLCASIGDYAIAQWVRIEEFRKFDIRATRPSEFWMSLSQNTCILIYCGIILLISVVALSRSFIFFTVCLRASINLHDRMFTSISKAVMKFFDTNTSGRILNRFSNDMGAVDEFLPNAMIDSTQCILNLVGAVFVLMIINVYLTIPTVVCCILFYVIRRYYLKTGRSVKRLEGIARSPVFAHVTATLQGLPTIRSNGAEVTLVSEFDRLQDTHSSAWFMFLSTSRAFGYWLDLICGIYIGLVTMIFFIEDADEISGDEVGLAITQCIALCGVFQWGMRQSAELENQMTSVERILEFTRVEHEPSLESEPGKQPPADWPQNGRIEYERVFMMYAENEPPVLKNLNFVIHPREKIGIVGRTGAGKSSLISTLFRLTHYEGRIIIDGVNIGEIGLHDLRRKISIIPQEPVIFSGTMRYNLDPFNEYTDEALLAALLVVEMKTALTEGRECLKQVMTEGGANLSVGQRQLVCLARAIVRNNCILVMDEATANVDAETDKFIQKTIREKFSHCTVLTIAHRLHTVMDSDRVLVMDAGQVVEMDHPHVLLQKKGFLSDMVEKTGTGMAESLRKMAKDNYIRKFR